MRLTSTTTPGQSRPGSNGNEEVIPHSLKLELHYQIQFNVINRILYFVGEVSAPCSRMQSGHTISNIIIHTFKQGYNGRCPSSVILFQGFLFNTNNFLYSSWTGWNGSNWLLTKIVPSLGHILHQQEQYLYSITFSNWLFPFLWHVMFLYLASTFTSKNLHTPLS